MRFYAWFERQLSLTRISFALAAPVVLFVILDLAVQLAFRWIWAPDQPFLSWEWSAVTIPVLVFIPAYALTLVALAAQMKRLGWWRLLESNQSVDAIRSLNWREFERLVAAAFAQAGWETEIVGQAGPDGGVDLTLRKGKVKAIVQCKQRRLPSGAYVTEREVREFAGVLAGSKGARGFLVTSGVFAPEAETFADKIPQLELIAGDDLLKMIGRCPKCKAGLEPRQGKLGMSLACVRYPTCDGTVSIAA